MAGISSSAFTNYVLYNHLLSLYHAIVNSRESVE